VNDHVEHRSILDMIVPGRGKRRDGTDPLSKNLLPILSVEQP
jgi:hypothetical protein